MTGPETSDGEPKGRSIRGVVLVIGTFVALLLWVIYAGSDAGPLAAESAVVSAASGPAFVQRTETEYNKRYEDATGEHDEGAKIFKRRCSTCHRDDGGGLEGLGTNLSDLCFIHGATISDHIQIIWKGVPGTTMRGFSRLGLDRVEQVALYVRSLHGTNVADGLACRGTRTP